MLDTTTSSRAALLQRSARFSLSLEAPVAEATPLFGPVREKEWEPGWAPVFVNPAEGVQREGAVFRVPSGHGHTAGIWVLTEYDPEAGRVSYVVHEPELMVSEIKVRLTPAGARKCRAAVSYRRTALAARANEAVAALDANWAAAQGPLWEAAVNAVLSRAARGESHG